MRIGTVVEGWNSKINSFILNVTLSPYKLLLERVDVKNIPQLWPLGKLKCHNFFNSLCYCWEILFLGH